jgi:O-antigen/teichoic acid export membrane protein
VGVFVRSGCKIFEPYLLGTDHPGMVSVSSAVGLIVNLILLWALLPRCGLIAAATSMTLGYVAGSALLLTGFVWLGRMTLKATLWPRKDDWRLFGNALGMLRKKLKVA